MIKIPYNRNINRQYIDIVRDRGNFYETMKVHPVTFIALPPTPYIIFQRTWKIYFDVRCRVKMSVYWNLNKIGSENFTFRLYSWEEGDAYKQTVWNLDTVYAMQGGNQNITFEIIPRIRSIPVNRNTYINFSIKGNGTPIGQPKLQVVGGWLERRTT